MKGAIWKMHKPQNGFLSNMVKNWRLLFTSSPKMMLLFIFWSLIYAIIDPLILFIENRFIETLNSYLVDEVIFQQILTILFVGFAIKVYKGFHDCMMGYIAQNSIVEGIKQFQTKLFEKCNRLTLDNFEVNELYNKIEKAVQASEELASSSGLMIYLLFFHLISVVSITVYLFLLSPVLALVTLFIFIPKFLSFKIKGSLFYNLKDELMPDVRKVNYLKRCIVDKEYFKETRVLNVSDFFLSQWINKLHEIIKKELAVEIRVFLIDLLLSLITFIGNTGIFLLAAYLLFEGKIQIGAFAVILIAAMRLFTILNAFTNLFAVAYQGIVNGGFVYEFLDMNEPFEGKNNVTLDKHITFDNVSYTYYGSDKKALNNVSVQINKGETVAIVGHNGSGKSTFIKVLLGMFKATDGRILYDYNDIDSINRKSIFAMSSVVMQTFGKYNLSLRENIGLSNVKHLEKDNKMLEVLKYLNFNIGSKKYIDGLDTAIGREFGGIELSGGEWQLISIARGLFKDSEIVLLDEPTSAIDPIRESEIYHLFTEFAQDKTAIIVTHRLGSAIMADRILVMDEGTIIEEGNHQQLLELNGYYAHMYEEQSCWYKR